MGRGTTEDLPTEIVETTNGRFIECLGTVTAHARAADLVAACFSGGARGLLIDASRLPAEFFDLSSRFAGEFVQKFVSYGIRLAVVMPPEMQHTERFHEFAREARSGRAFRLVESRDEAENWLT